MDKEVLSKLKYLDLEINSSRINKMIIENKHVYCFANERYAHVFHSENVHLNTVTDLSYHLLNNQQALSNSYEVIFRSFLNLFQKLNSKVDEVTKNVLQLQASIDMSRFRKLSTKSDINELIDQIHKEPKRIEQVTMVLLNEVKTNIDKLNKVIPQLEEKINLIIG